jgi:hypothetical protein
MLSEAIRAAGGWKPGLNQDSMLTQLLCHAAIAQVPFFGIEIPLKAQWNLDGWRPSESLPAMIRHRCNPGPNAPPEARGPQPQPQPQPPPPPPPPPPQAAVTISKGDSAQGRPDCTSPACRYVVVTFSGFPAGDHEVTCRATGEEGGYYSYSRPGESDTSAVCYYGYPGRTVWVTVDDVQSNQIVW